MIVIINKRVLEVSIIFLLIIIITTIGIIVYNKEDVTSVINQKDVISRPIEHGSSSSNFIAFACNVDWGNEIIPEMLRILKEKNVKITFL